ncbi:tetratricopeptide repeat-containing glycosyltransferase family 2 protein [Halobacillus faecis]|uniref:Beta 1,4 glucosyltransferase n=1 Tax=Halobacillus faecis TaxID=360184 RepID=A0A511WRQ7_9BACI|nr:glycosyltransferase family 2 protein [Halobacillus faecis]GEN53830.1 beta 1,4 glucosyltransferase [Halobacillus faecis]
MPTISLCMIVKNEEEVLANCLRSVQEICDEIIIVDTGSTDKTKEVAKPFTEKILDFEWIDDFSAARNYSFSQATKDFILWLDADDVLLPADQEKFKNLKDTLDDSIDAVSMRYIVSRDEYGNPAFHYRRNRLVKRSNHFKWIGPVHEYLEVSGHILNSDIAVEHKKDAKEASNHPTGRNLRIYENRIKKGEDFSPRDLFYYANELRDHGQYQKAIIYYNEFLLGQKGWVEDNILACIYLAACHGKLGERDEQIEALLKTLCYDAPRPEPCCRIGDYFKEKKAFQTAVFWYNIATVMKKETGGFQSEAYSTWYPHLQLCVCQWETGNVQKSIEHNKIAKQYRPNDPQILFNEKFFNDYMKNK